MSEHTPDEARPIHITDGPIDIQLVDLTLAMSSLDHDFRTACVVVWIALDHDSAGADPALMPLDRYWSPPIDLDEAARWRWIETEVIAKDLFDVRPQLAAEVELLSDDLAVLTIWPVAETWAPGVRRAVVTKGIPRIER